MSFSLDQLSEDQRRDYADNEPGDRATCDGWPKGHDPRKRHNPDPDDCSETLDGISRYCSDCATLRGLVQCCQCERLGDPIAELSYDGDYQTWDCHACLAKEREHQARVVRAQQAVPIKFDHF